MSQILERIVVPPKTRFIPALKSGSFKILPGNQLSIELNQFHSEYLPIDFDEILFEQQKNSMELEKHLTHRNELIEKIKEDSKPKQVLKQSQALEGLQQLLYQHTNDVLEDIASYEKPPFNGKTKHDLLIRTDRKIFETIRVISHANKFQKLFEKLIALNQDRDDFSNYDELIKEIHSPNSTFKIRYDNLYDLAIIARENLPEKITLVYEEIEEPVFDNPSSVTE